LGILRKMPPLPLPVYQSEKPGSERAWVIPEMKNLMMPGAPPFLCRVAGGLHVGFVTLLHKML
jgi:hypothetical protein